MSEVTGRRAIVLDIDHTILNTTLFHHQLAHALGRLFGINAQRFLDERPKYDSDERGYDLNAHLAQYGQKLLWVQTRLLAELLSMRTVRYIYDDAFRALRLAMAKPNTDVWLMTTGDADTQQFKVDLIKRILKLAQIDLAAGLKSKIISTGATKGFWLAHQWRNGLAINGTKYDRIVLVDDNPVHFRYLNDTPGFIGLQIRRPREDGTYRYEESEKAFIRFICRLDQALEYLEEVTTPN